MPKKLLISGFNQIEYYLCVETYKDITNQNFFKLPNKEKEETLEVVFVKHDDEDSSCNNNNYQKSSISSKVEHKKSSEYIKAWIEKRSNAGQ